MGKKTKRNLSLTTTTPDVLPASSTFDSFLETTIKNGGNDAVYASMVKGALDLARNDQYYLGSAVSNGGLGGAKVAVGGLVGINDYGVKGRRQYSAERRRLLDLYVIAYNNSDIRSAIMHLRNEVFRRGLDWEPAFEFKCDECNTEYTQVEAKRMGFRCDCLTADDPDDPHDGHDHLRDTPPQHGPKLRRPDKHQISKFDKFLKSTSYFGKSVESLLRSMFEDLCIVDDGFLYLRNYYYLSEEDYEHAKDDPYNHEYAPQYEVKQIFRLDPTLVEISMDQRGIVGQLLHSCPFHRATVLDVPYGEGWDIEWKGRCPECGLRTYPIYYKYSEQQSSAFGAHRAETLYLYEDEVIHTTMFTDSETYGFPPILSIYEKALTLIGMDRFLYDYFYERRMPQGVVTVVTDDVIAFNQTKATVEAQMQRDPHYIPWMAISGKNGAGKMEFIRFGYSLDELDYLPVRDEIRERISALFGVQQIWTGGSPNPTGLNGSNMELTVMSRVVENAQRLLHINVFPKLQRALGVTEWNLRIKTPEEVNEQAELAIFQMKVQIAEAMKAMGFGVEFDSDQKDFSYNGRVPSLEEQQQAQAGMANLFGGGGGAPGMPQEAQAGMPPPQSTPNPVGRPPTPGPPPMTGPEYPKLPNDEGPQRPQPYAQ